MSHAVLGYPRQTDHCIEFWQNVVHQRSGNRLQHSCLENPTDSMKRLKDIWLQYSCLENSIYSMKRQNDMTLENEAPRLEGVHYPTGEEWRAITNSSRKNEAAGPKWKWHTVVDISGGESKVWYSEEQYCILTWNVRSTVRVNWIVVKQEMAKQNTDISGISKLKWTGMGEFNSDDHYTHYCEQKYLRRNRIALTVNKWIWNTVLGCNLKNDRMILVHFQGKLSNFTVIQVYAPATDAKEAEVDWFYEDLQHLLELTQKKRCPFHHRGPECKSRKLKCTWSNRQVGP